ncbi:MAG: hypothetical protein RLY38_504 [Actinomycetota bacterium]
MIVAEMLPVARTLFRSKPIANSRQDRILGALLGAAIGDVMGSAITGLTKENINQQYGEWGICSPPYDSVVSHNFQLTLFALDALINSTQKSQKLSVTGISECLLKCAKEWETVVNHPNLYHGINHLADKNSVCTDFMKNYPLWRFKRPGIKTINTNISEQINPMLLALLLCANHKTVYEVSINLTNTLGIPVTQLDFSIFPPLLISYETVTKANKISGLNEMRKQINQSENPALIGMMAGFEHGAKYGINAFKQIWYLRIDAMSLSEQMGCKVGRNIKSF